MENNGEKWRKMGKNRQGPPPVPTQNAFEVEMVRSEAGELQPVPTPANISARNRAQNSGFNRTDPDDIRDQSERERSEGQNI